MLASELLEVSLTEVVNWSLKVVPALRLSAGVAVKVLSLLEADGAADIFIQVEKLSEESWKLPEQLVSLVFEVIVPVDIASLKITATVVAGELKVELSSGLTEETVGLVVSVVVVVVVPEELELLVLSSFSPQEMIVRLKSDMRIMYKTLLIFFLHQ